MKLPMKVAKFWQSVIVAKPECWPGRIVMKARDTDETPKRVGQIKWYRKPEFPMKARGLVWFKGDDSLSSI